MLAHKWSSLVSTVSLLVLCVTGLPLVFSDELKAWSTPVSEARAVATSAPRRTLDALAREPQLTGSKRFVQFIFWPDNEPDDDAHQTAVHARAGRCIERQVGSGSAAAVVSARARDLAAPLHFGDYGGLPLKVVWAGFDSRLIGLSVLLGLVLALLSDGPLDPLAIGLVSAPLAAIAVALLRAPGRGTAQRSD